MNTNETDTKVETDGVMNIEKWTVWSLDVWGNEDDGFEVNNRSRRATIELPVNATGEQTLAALIDCGALKESVTLLDIDILDYYEEHMEIEAADNSRPLYHLERCEA